MKRFLKENQKTLIATFLAIIAPFVIYWIERKTGKLPSVEGYWAAHDGNHGPWRYSGEGLWINYPLYLLMFIVAFRAIKKAFRIGNWSGFSDSLLLLLIQFVGIILQLYFLFWTVD